MAREGFDGNGDGVVKFRHGWIPIAEYHGANRESPSDWTHDAPGLRAHPTEGESSDARLGAMWAAQGFDGPPDVMPAHEFDALPATYTRIFRGLHGEQSEEYAEQFKSGDAFPGLGVHGNGTYTTTDHATAQEFAGLEYGEGSMVKMALRPEAKIGTPSEVWAEYDRRAARDGTPREVEYAFDGDVGKIATALGYDAVKVPNPGGDEFPGDYYIVQNRTALVISGPPKTAPAVEYIDYDEFRDR